MKCLAQELTCAGCVLGGAALWIGGIPDYIARRGGECEAGIAEELKTLLAPFGKLEYVKGRYKQPGAQATREEHWQGGSWGLVTFTTKAACEKAQTQGVRVAIQETPCSGTKQPVEIGCLMVKLVDKKLAAQSPIGRLAAEQHVARMERALYQYKHYVRLHHLLSVLDLSTPVTRCNCATVSDGPSCYS